MTAEYSTDPASRARLLRRVALEDALMVDAEDYSVSADERDVLPSDAQIKTAAELVAHIVRAARPGLDRADEDDLAKVRLEVDDTHLEVFVGGDQLARIPRATLRLNALNG